MHQRVFRRFCIPGILLTLAVLGIRHASDRMVLWGTGCAVTAGELSSEERGFRNLTQRAYGIPSLNPKALETIWKVWEPEWKVRVNPDDPAQIRKLVFERYGFTDVPFRKDGVPLQFVATEKGWVPTCMQCHSGRLPGSGQGTIGLPNTEIDLATFAEDLAKNMGIKTDQSRLGLTRGRTNAFMFSIELLRVRETDLSKRKTPLDMGPHKNADLDAIPWWHLKKKNRLYADGGVTGNFVRPIMQFTLAGPSGEEIRSWEQDFSDILSYLRSIEPPKYLWPVDPAMAGKGKEIFERTCSPCHGTYGSGGKYPNRVVPIEEVGTDPLRLTGVTKEFRGYFNRTWLGEYSHVEENPTGYIAPPLDGIWASAPYFHNGSVPTVYGVLTPESRPKFFRRVGAPIDYDVQDLGFKVEILDGRPTPDLAPEARRRIVDTTLPGLSNQGHSFGSPLTETEKRQVIEYLKTL